MKKCGMPIEYTREQCQGRNHTVAQNWNSRRIQLENMHKTFSSTSLSKRKRNKDNNSTHAEVVMGTTRRSQSYRKNYRGKRAAEIGRNTHPKGWANGICYPVRHSQLHKHACKTEQAIKKNICIYIYIVYIYGCTNSYQKMDYGKRVWSRQESMDQEKKRRNSVIVS